MRVIDADPAMADRPDFGSGVSDRARALQWRPLAELSLGEIAFCLRQGIAVPHVAQLSVAALTAQPLIEAEFYPGDLLASLLHAASRHDLGQATAAELADICVAAEAATATLQAEVLPAAAAFLASHRA